MEFLLFLNAVLELVPEVVAAGLLVAAVVNLVKLIDKLKPGAIPDGIAGLISLIINAAAWIFLWFAGPRLGDVEAVQVLTEAGQIATLVVVLLTSLAASKIGHQVMGWLGIAVHLGSEPKDRGYIARVERVPTINRILDDLDAEMPRAA